MSLAKGGATFKARVLSLCPLHRRYVDEFVALAAALRDGQQLAVSPQEELLVQETVLRASEM